MPSPLPLASVSVCGCDNDFLYFVHIYDELKKKIVDDTYMKVLDTNFIISECFSIIFSIFTK